MPKKEKEIDSISQFFSKEGVDLSPEEKWDLIFQDWIRKIDQKKMIMNLFELKLWFESLEEFFTSNYLEKLIFEFQAVNSRNYNYYLSMFNNIVGKIINLLKDLDFKKDKYLLNFEEFIVENILESYTTKSFPFLRDIYSAESWFYSLRTFLQNLKNLALELGKSNAISYKTMSSIKKLYHKELMNNSILISLLKRKFIPKMDKIYQQDISDIIASINDKELKKQLGIFFIFSFRVMKINNFIEVHLKKGRQLDLAVPLILNLKRRMDDLFYFYENILKKSFESFFSDSKELKEMKAVFQSFEQEYRKIFEGEFPNFFKVADEKVNQRKLLKNVIIISDFAVQELIESILKMFKPEIPLDNIFENYMSRKQKSLEVKKKLTKLHSKISDYFSSTERITADDIFYEINLFMESDLNYLLYKDWNEFLSYYNTLVSTDFSSEFKINLRSFHSFITQVLKDMIIEAG